MAEKHEKKYIVLDKKRALELYNQGKSDGEIAEELYVTSMTVGNWRRLLRLPANRVVKKQKQKSRLAEMATEARAHGMNYGMYMAMRKEENDSNRDRHRGIRG